MLRRILESATRSGRDGEAVLRVLVPVQLHAHAAHERVARKPVELRPHVVGAEVGIGDDRVRPSRLVRRPLHPGRLVLISLGRPVGLHVDRLDDAEAVRCRRETPRSDSRAGWVRRGRKCAAASAPRARAGRPAARCGDGRRRRESRGPPAPERQNMIDDRGRGPAIDHVVDEAQRSRPAPRCAGGSRGRRRAGSASSAARRCARASRPHRQARSDRRARGRPRR